RPAQRSPDSDDHARPVASGAVPRPQPDESFRDEPRASSPVRPSCNAARPLPAHPCLALLFHLCDFGWRVPNPPRIDLEGTGFRIPVDLCVLVRPLQLLCLQLPLDRNAVPHQFPCNFACRGPTPLSDSLDLGRERGVQAEVENIGFLLSGFCHTWSVTQTSAGVNPCVLPAWST